MMQIIDLSFDNGQGDAKVDIANGVLQIIATDKNPNVNGNFTLNIPLDPLFQKLEDQAPNLLVSWGEKAGQALVDNA